MSCTYARFAVWTLRRWFASDRSLRQRASLELAWLEMDLALAWSWFETFLSIIDFECTRELAILSPGKGVTLTSTSGETLTSDETAVLSSLLLAPWSVAAAGRCLTPFLSRTSAAAAAQAAACMHRTLPRQTPSCQAGPGREAPSMKSTKSLTVGASSR